MIVAAAGFFIVNIMFQKMMRTEKFRTENGYVYSGFMSDSTVRRNYVTFISEPQNSSLSAFVI